MAVFTYTATAIGGGPENGAFCYVYTRGTTTPATTYSDVGRTIPRTNPIVADADGRVPPAYFADATQLTFVVKTANGATTLLQVEYDGTGFFASYVQIDQLTLFSLDYTADGAQTKALTGRVISSPYQLLVAFDGDLQPTDNYTIVTDGTDSTLTWATNCQPASTVRVTIRAAVLQALSPAIGIDLSSSLVTPTGDSEDTLANWLALKAPLDSPAFTGSPNAVAPLVLAYSGQSNAGVVERSYTWTPPTNLRVWNGSAFAAPTGTVISSVLSWAAQYARNNPSRQVRLVGASFGGVSIDAWLPAGNTMWLALKAAVEAALTALGQTTIDRFFWWQGEADFASAATYGTRFETFVTRLQAETWFPYSTPMVLMGVTEFLETGDQATVAAFNVQLAKLAAAQPSFRTYVHSSDLPTAYWTSGGSDLKAHMTAVGYDLVGRMAADAQESTVRGVGKTPYYTDPYSLTHQFTSTVNFGNDANFSLSKPTSTSAVLSFDLLDGIGYDQTSNTMSFTIGLAGIMTLTSAGASVAGALAATTAGNPARFTNTTDTGSVIGLIIEGDRATPTASDILQFDWMLSDSAGNQDIFGRIDLVASDVTSTSEDSYFRMYARVAGSLTNMYRFTHGSFRPESNDQHALGTATVSWADLFLASGGVINFNNGNLTATHSAGNLLVSSASASAPISVRNTTDAAANTGLIIESDRATPAANDNLILDFRLSDSAGNQDTFARITAIANVVTSTSESGNMTFGLMKAGTLTTLMILGGSASTLAPNAIVALALGTTSLMWSDLFLASGGVVNFNNGDVLITHSANTLAFTGASTGYTFDSAVSISGTLTLTAASLVAGAAGVDWVARHAANDRAVSFYGGNGSAVGAGIQLFGGTHATLANVGTLTSGATTAAAWDATAVTAFVPFKMPVYAFASLPAAATVGAGARAFVNNATATTFGSVVAGGGANFVPVYSDGTNWRIG